MDALVLGGSGLVGERIVMALQRAGFRMAYTYLGNALDIQGAEGIRMDISDSEALTSLLETKKTRFVINTVALPSVDKCDDDEELAFKVNAEPQKLLADFSNRTGAGIAFISTSNVFGPSDRSFSEDDRPGPINTYGRTKLRGEEYTLRAKRHIILRTDQVYAWTREGQKKTFVEKTLGKLENGETVEVCRDWFNCPTYADDLAVALVKLFAGSHWGVFHAVGPTYINRYEWAVRIADAFTLDRSLVRTIDSSVLGLPARRSNCSLSNKKIERVSGVRFLSVDEGLERMMTTRSSRHP